MLCAPPFQKSQHIATVLSDTYGGKRVARRLRLCVRPTIGSRPRDTGKKKKMLLPSRSSRQVLHEATHLKVATPRNYKHCAPLPSKVVFVALLLHRARCLFVNFYFSVEKRLRTGTSSRSRSLRYHLLPHIRTYPQTKSVDGKHGEPGL